MKYNEVNPFNGNNIEEDAPANATGPSVAGTGDDNTVHTKKKKKNLYDGRTKVARKFIERILKQRESRLKSLTKEEVNKEESLTEKVDKKLALKILSMKKSQDFKKTSGDFVPQIYLSGMDKDNLKKEFGKLPRGLPSASSGVPVVDMINHALGKDGVIDTEGGDTNNPKLISWDKGGKTIGKPRTVGDAAKMAGLRLENVELAEGDIRKVNVKKSGTDFDVFYKGNTKYGRNKLIGYFSRSGSGFEVYHDNEDMKDDFQQSDFVKTERQAIDLIFDTAESNGVIKESVELDEVVSAKDKKVIDDFVQMNKGTGAQNFTQRGSIVDYEGRSLEKKGGMGAQQIASLESDPKDDYKIKIRAKMDGKSTQSIVNYLKKSAKKYNVKVEHFERKFSSDVVETADSFNNEYLFVENNLKILQNIVKKKQNSKMKFKDNKTSIVDLYTASAIMNVYNAVKKDNKKKMEKLINGTLADFLKVQGVAFKAHRS